MKLFDRIKRGSADVRVISALCNGAEGEAGRDGQALPGAEHLLLAALALPDQTARRAFERVGTDLDALRAAIVEQHADALAAVGLDADASDDEIAIETPGRGAFRATASFDRLLREAGDEARSKGAPLVGAHVVAATCRMEHGTAPRALRAMGISFGELLAAAESEIDALART